ncbi:MULTISPECIES: hypothetical protein [unclassified Shewanella]|jgi:uncharacterized membrane protein|uniref:DUF4870 family protein n=1 Tax=unclassified Shewanella TaxID=196818 RepID=UPI00137BAE2A|nr:MULTISPECIES: hypothetical protein [unclassified Shewanella]MBO1896781.1 hypothetical protein [Shewanella sp. BF02_Schw]QHS12957.1 hypothetical protein GUY17_07415 [Shewanella sp. Arc9-LZ]|tara:strand:+ start:325 stop:675 length:351 start_codon:yes stop_codon:yes gene_type:complete
MSEVVENVPTTKEQAKIVYLLYMVGLLFGITGIIGVVMAYINKGDAPEWLKTHYQFQIRTFWIGAIYIFLGSILSLVIIGWFVLLFWAVWLIIRSLKGMKALELEKPIENPTGWLF